VIALSKRRSFEMAMRPSSGELAGNAIEESGLTGARRAEENSLCRAEWKSPHQDGMRHARGERGRADRMDLVGQPSHTDAAVDAINESEKNERDCE